MENRLKVGRYGIMDAYLCKGRDPAEQTVINWLCYFINLGNSAPSQAEICESAGMSVATLNRHLSRLEEEGTVVRVRTKSSDGKTNLNTRYSINIMERDDDSSWKTYVEVRDEEGVLSKGEYPQNESRGVLSKGESIYNRNIDNNIIYNNIDTNTLERESVREKTSLSYAEKKEGGETSPTRADALVVSVAKSAEKEKSEAALEKLLAYWNETFAKNYQNTAQLKDAWRSAMKKFTLEEVMVAVNAYVKYVTDNSWYTHRFSLYEFVKQANGIPKYVNM